MAFPTDATIVNFSHNKIRSLTINSFFQDVEQVIKLDFSYNLLSELTTEVFSNFVNLKTLVLRNNNITLLDSQVSFIFRIHA